MFHIPENILEIYEPSRYQQQFFRMQQMDSIALGNKLTQYYDWKPLKLAKRCSAACKDWQ